MTSSDQLVADELYAQLERALHAAKQNKTDLYTAIVEAPFTHDRDMAFLFLGFITFLVLDTQTDTVVAGSVTDNDYYHQSVAGYNFSLSDYHIPLSATENSIVQAITSGQPVTSDNWDSFKRPKVEDGVARLNQANSGIGYAAVYPVQGKLKGALMFNFYQFPEAIGQAQAEFMRHYSKLVSEALG